ncbi:hypothetical protein F4810DRAFT_707406 [Camillea tinctor]|nr:hypothetical protein F4810DRAFT_707406 [Camillea tinctor]
MASVSRKVVLRDHYLPQILRYFDSDGNPKPRWSCSIDCAICREPLAIFQPADADHHAFTCLPCGHVFGYKCINTWLTTCESEPACPSCRMSLIHSGCHCLTKIKPLEFSPGFNINSIRPNYTEVPTMCRKCKSHVYRGPSGQYVPPRGHGLSRNQVHIIQPTQELYTMDYRPEWQPWVPRRANPSAPRQPQADARGRQPRENLAAFPTYGEIGRAYHQVHQNSNSRRQPLAIHPLVAQASLAAHARAQSLSETRATPHLRGGQETGQEAGQEAGHGDLQTLYEERGSEANSEPQPSSSSETPESPKEDEMVVSNEANAQELGGQHTPQPQVLMPEHQYRPSPQQIHHHNHTQFIQSQIRRLASGRLANQLARHAQGQMHMREAGQAGRQTHPIQIGDNGLFTLPYFPNDDWTNAIPTPWQFL